MSIRIDRCVCTNRTFADLLDEAQADGLSLEQLMCESGAGNGCQLCRPYLQNAIRTGQTVFTEMIVDASAEKL